MERRIIEKPKQCWMRFSTFTLQTEPKITLDSILLLEAAVLCEQGLSYYVDMCPSPLCIRTRADHPFCTVILNSSQEMPCKIMLVHCPQVCRDACFDHAWSPISLAMYPLVRDLGNIEIGSLLKREILAWSWSDVRDKATKIVTATRSNLKRARTLSPWICQIFKARSWLYWILESQISSCYQIDWSRIYHRTLQKAHICPNSRVPPQAISKISLTTFLRKKTKGKMYFHNWQIYYKRSWKVLGEIALFLWDLRSTCIVWRKAWTAAFQRLADLDVVDDGHVVGV